MWSFGGAFANVSYTDIVGKSIIQDSRKAFFSSKQLLTGLELVLSAFFAKQVISSTGFPMNYAYAILIGFLALSIASLGFWSIKEVIPALFPLLGGWLIKMVSFESFFILYIIIVLCSIFFIYKIRCTK